MLYLISFSARFVPLKIDHLKDILYFVGFSCLQLDSSRTRLFASSKDHVIYEYNCTNFNVNPGKIDC